PALSKFELTDDRTVHTKQSVIGDSGFGYFRQTAGHHQVDGDVVLGNQKGSKGLYDLAGGKLTAGGVVVGNAGEATFNQTGGTTEVEKLAIGKETTGIGTYILAGESMLKGGQVTVAVSGTGTLDQQGGTIALTAGASTYRSNYFADESMQPATLDVAQNGSADGNLVMRDGIRLFRSGQNNPALRVGVGGDGTLTVGGDKVSPAIIEDKNVQT